MTWRPPRSHTGFGWWHLLALTAVVEIEVRRRPSERSLEGGIDWWNWFELGVFAVIGLRILVRITTPRFDHAAIVCIVGYGASSAVSATYAPSPTLALARACQLLVMVAATLELDRHIARHGTGIVHRWLHALVTVTTVAVTIGIAERLAIPTRHTARFTWLDTHSVLSGAVLALSVVVLYAMWLAQPAARLPWRRGAYLALLALHAGALVATRTRGSIAAALAAIITMSLWWLGTRRRDLVVTMVLALVGLGLTAAEPIVGYLLRSATTSELSTLNSRTEVWRIAWRMIGERPLMGHGLTASRGAFIADTGLGGAHNAYLNLLVDVGIVGMAWWTLIAAITVANLVVLVRRCRLTSRAAPLGGADAFCTVTIGGLLICQVINGLTAEWIGVGVSTSTAVLFVSALWARAVANTAPSIRA